VRCSVVGSVVLTLKTAKNRSLLQIPTARMVAPLRTVSSFRQCIKAKQNKASEVPSSSSSSSSVLRVQINLEKILRISYLSVALLRGLFGWMSNTTSLEVEFFLYWRVIRDWLKESKYLWRLWLQKENIPVPLLILTAIRKHHICDIA